ncbi:MAG: helix-turn-helix domain-containing protein [Candidatus Marinimicrobia bacterium]|nr:helix-turn-helix domain-containing protein [Candidatus Neomarinimicrobiota bacterium]
MIKSGQWFDRQASGFGSFCEVPYPPSGHTHDTIEISVFEGGTVNILYGGQPVKVPPRRLVAHWGMLPHQILQRNATARVIGVHLPLPWVLEWTLPGHFLSRLLDLEYVIAPPSAAPASDVALLRDWHELLRARGPCAAEIVLLEVRARLLRLAQCSALPLHTPAPAAPPPPPSAFSRALRFIIRNFRGPLGIRSIAAAAGLSPRHLTRIFAEYTGQTVNGYITSLRLAHARRLLSTTDRTILDILNDSGFSCATQFYKLFRAQTGLSPRGYRRQAQ